MCQYFWPHTVHWNGNSVIILFLIEFCLLESCLSLFGCSILIQEELPLEKIVILLVTG